MTTMVVMKIPPVVLRDFDRRQDSVDTEQLSHNAICYLQTVFCFVSRSPTYVVTNKICNLIPCQYIVLSVDFVDCNLPLGGGRGGMVCLQPASVQFAVLPMATLEVSASACDVAVIVYCFILFPSSSQF